ncbi:TIGR04086 family membrane protein [Desulfotomaculum sp. 1211_IL3151]|uniref:TIGR04086 family membrane protein n=1 Tax=Desulfotomaculum sp. 1211_IL3151 TaxID=3084055 RepID=UPI002FD8A6F7
MAFKQDVPRTPMLNFTSIFRGTLVALGFSFVFSVLAGLIYYFTNAPEKSMSWVAILILFLSVLLGAGYAARRTRSKGLFNGLGVGILTFIIIWLLVGLFLPGNVLFPSALGKLVLALAAGGLGGILGIGLTS